MEVLYVLTLIASVSVESMLDEVSQIHDITKLCLEHPRREVEFWNDNDQYLGTAVLETYYTRTELYDALQQTFVEYVNKDGEKVHEFLIPGYEINEVKFDEYSDFIIANGKKSYIN